MDAREQLRRFLEQRREAGETELVFDQLSVEEAMRLLGAGPPPEAGGRRQEAGKDRNVPIETSATTNSGEWRKVLKDVGAAPSVSSAPIEETGAPREKGARFAMPTPAPSTSEVTTHATMPLDNVPPGIIVGGTGRELFGGASPFATLDDLSTAVSTCTLCSLYRDAKNPVPGEGNPNADLMCVGEAPGATEDELGRPFVGQAGQLLDKILAAIKLARSDVYICNVLKHRPPGNRNPMPDEVQACSPFLLRQIELIQPRVIVAFGTFAAQTLLNTREGIGKLRGKVHRYYGVPLVVTYHPAALLRNPGWKRPTWEDVQLARKLLDRANGS
jgi:uracil-DNA glycosylase